MTTGLVSALAIASLALSPSIAVADGHGRHALGLAPSGSEDANQIIRS